MRVLDKEFVQSHVMVSPDGCWLWTGSVDNYGYGIFRTTSKQTQFRFKMHRVSYESVKGPIPEGLVIDHLCRQRSCVRPDHMEPVTLKVNVLRGSSIFAKRARQTHCQNGHEFTPENTRRHGKEGRNRRCITCDKTYRLSHYAANRELEQARSLAYYYRTRKLKGW